MMDNAESDVVTFQLDKKSEKIYPELLLLTFQS